MVSHPPGAPWPTVNVRPDLILAGADKLKLEEEGREEKERRRGMND